MDLAEKMYNIMYIPNMYTYTFIVLFRTAWEQRAFNSGAHLKTLFSLMPAGDSKWRFRISKRFNDFLKQASATDYRRNPTETLLKAKATHWLWQFEKAKKLA